MRFEGEQPAQCSIEHIRGKCQGRERFFNRLGEKVARKNIPASWHTRLFALARSYLRFRYEVTAQTDAVRSRVREFERRNRHTRKGAETNTLSTSIITLTN